MEGLTVRKKVIPQASSTATSPADVAIGILIFVVMLVAIPFLLIGILIGILRDKFAPPKPTKPVQPRPIVRHEVLNSLFPLHYHYIMGDEISEGAWDYFDDEPLIIYQPGTSNDFFEGYFSNFKIECPRGIFVQKVNFNSTLTEVESMPLCFFNYNTKESEELLDLKGYTLYTIEQPNCFTITATNQEDNVEEFAAKEFELEIVLTDALYSPPEAF
ncbi:hypothetical protein GO988_17600 [Hymenobacter sp. HMF4947]|uniref:Uncharacterized protein n=1 Tax=Hymenobacter ginkgonis TaxID=2682976 RepID=A0A7K1TIB6_9BACT|nr:hypothetical protein [Hymenobacter ginkgonis]MVN78147.1 hypothetical protein [Hymenobacter ginkgonis]